MSNHRSLCLCIGLLFSIATFSQLDSSQTRLKAFVQNINTFNALLPQEKVYLHFDNTSYFIGEKMWFKAYVVNPTQNCPTNRSKVLYVELLNQQGYVLQTKKLKIDENGQCHGDFDLSDSPSDSLFAGYYEVRAYTRYMLNFDQSELLKTDSYFVFPHDGFGFIEWVPATKETLSQSKYVYHNCNTIFSRVFAVYCKPSIEGDYVEKKFDTRSWIPTLTLKDLKKYMQRLAMYGDHDSLPNLKTEIPQKPNLEYAFYPEGGDLIKGLPSKVAVKATTGDGRNASIQGVVMDERRHIVSEFKTSDKGLGFFTFCPTGQTKRFIAQVKYLNDTIYSDFPSSLDSGYVLRVSRQYEKKSTNLQILGANTSSNEQLGLSLMCRGQIVWFDTLSMSNGRPRVLHIPDSILPIGVIQATLFNVQGRIYAERLFFTNSIDMSNLSLSTHSSDISLLPFNSVDLHFQLLAKTNKPVKTKFSLAIRDASTKQETYHTDNIKTNLLLSSELKGYIYNPAYYFESQDSIHRQNLDLLLMTQGWRRYDWKKMAGVDSFLISEPNEKELTLDGYVMEGGEIASGVVDVLLNLGYTDTLLLTGEQKMKSDGSFRFNMIDFYGKHYAAFDFFKNGIQRTEKSMKRDVFSIGMQGAFNRFAVLPKSNFSIYETSLPDKMDSVVIETNQSQNNLNKQDIVLKDIVIQSKAKNKRATSKYPDFINPNFTISGEEALEMVLDQGFNGFNDTTFIHYKLRMAPLPELNFIAFIRYLTHRIFRLIVDPSDFYVIRRSELISSSPKRLFRGGIFGDDLEDIQTLAKMRVVDIKSISFYLQSSSRLPYDYSYPSAYVLIRMANSDTRIMLNDFRRTRFDGFSYLSDCYNPDYSRGVPPLTQDYRRTLYWNPDVQTDSTGRASIQFYNNSSCEHLDISAEGITTEGVPFVYKK